MRIYALVVSYVAYAVATFGFILPYLISAASTELVIAGYFVLALFPVISYYYYTMIVKLKKEKLNENS
jgi:hypothetical protein